MTIYPDGVASLEALSEWVSERVRHGTAGGRLGEPAEAVPRRHTTLAGTVALVTDASSGIGTATAALLAHFGADVALVALRWERLDAVVEGIRAVGATALAVECDITDEEQAAGAIAEAVGTLGRLDTLVDNAGVVLGAQRRTNAALPHLVRAAGDSPREVADLVIVGSRAGGLDPLRQELSARSVRVSVVGLETVEALHPDDVADEVAHIVTRSSRVAVDEVLVRAANPHNRTEEP